MPGGSIAYDYRIYHCDFINHNSGNRDIVSDREVYAAGNYLDHASDKKNSSELRYLSPSGLADHLMYIFGYSDAPAPAPDWTESYVGIGREADGVLLSQDETLFPQGLLLRRRVLRARERPHHRRRRRGRLTHRHLDI